MSNHSGGRMINEILNLLDKEQVFAPLEKSKTQALIQRITEIATRTYDCNTDEILYELGDKFAVCECCGNPNDTLKKGICPDCCFE